MRLRRSDLYLLNKLRRITSHLLNSYLDLNWHYSIETAKDNKNKTYYIVYVDELPGVATDAYSIPEAMELIKDAMLGVFKLYIKHGEEIPVPINEKQFKGNIAYRTTPSRHCKIAQEAKRPKISLSEALDTFVDNGIGNRS